MKKDLILGAIGTVALVAGMVGIFQLNAAQAGPGFDVAWPTNQTALPSSDGRTEEGAESVVELNITAQNVTRIELTLAWSDDVANSAPDTFELVLTSPDGREIARAEADAGALGLVADNLTVHPEPIRVNAASADAAEASLASRYASDAAVGVWTVTIRMVSAGETSTAVGDLPVPQDNGNDWTLGAIIVAYAADAQ